MSTAESGIADCKWNRRRLDSTLRERTIGGFGVGSNESFSIASRAVGKALDDRSGGTATAEGAAAAAEAPHAGFFVAVDPLVVPLTGFVGAGVGLGTVSARAVKYVSCQMCRKRGSSILPCRFPQADMMLHSINIKEK